MNRESHDLDGIQAKYNKRRKNYNLARTHFHILPSTKKDIIDYARVRDLPKMKKLK